MEQHFTPRDYIAAAERLYQYSANKRFKVTDNHFVDDKIGEIAKFINSQISGNSGLNVFAISNPNELLSYEGFLNHKVSAFTETYIVKRDVSDEIDILLTYEHVDTNEVADRTIIISPPFETMISKLPINSDDLIAACKAPASIMKSSRHESDSLHQYLCATTVAIDGNNYNLSYHLDSANDDKPELNLHAIFLVDDAIYSIHSDNPANLFLECIDKYGLEIQIGDQIKRIFSYRKINIEHPVRLEDIGTVVQMIPRPGDLEFLLYAPTKIDAQNPHILSVEFVYGVSVTRFQASLEQLVGGTK